MTTPMHGCTQDVIEALKQDAVIRQKAQTLPDSLGGSTRLLSSAKAGATVAVLYLVVLPLSLLAAAAAWAPLLLRRLLSGGEAPAVGVASRKHRGTALVSGVPLWSNSD